MSIIDFRGWHTSQRDEDRDNFIAQIKAVLDAMKLGDYGNAQAALKCASVSHDRLKRTDHLETRWQRDPR